MSQIFGKNQKIPFFTSFYKSTTFIPPTPHKDTTKKSGFFVFLPQRIRTFLRKFPFFYIMSYLKKFRIFPLLPGELSGRSSPLPVGNV